MCVTDKARELCSLPLQTEIFRPCLTALRPHHSSISVFIHTLTLSRGLKGNDAALPAAQVKRTGNMSDLKTINTEGTKIVRVVFDKGPCQIAGVVEGETKNFVKTVKTFQGFFVRHRIAKKSVHTVPCSNCPDADSIKARWFQPGRDMKNAKS